MRRVAEVGGKNASLGELMGGLKASGVRVPGGFATTASAYWAFLDAQGLRPRIAAALAEFHRGRASLEKTSATIRAMVLKAPLPDELVAAITAAYRNLSRAEGLRQVAVAAPHQDVAVERLMADVQAAAGQSRQQRASLGPVSRAVGGDGAVDLRLLSNHGIGHARLPTAVRSLLSAH
ncbi:MAG: PEP/pyruvate-binding domain-containing protein [Rhodospirillaceae bacterium]|nr:PEP/pyruvate-binding domain-containing protein [Rhodospirillaceae bacterium]